MGQIRDIELQLQERLLAQIAGVDRLSKQTAGLHGRVDVPLKVASYPKKPTESSLKTLAAAGAVLTRFVGSKYGTPRKVGEQVIQDRVMVYEVLVVSDSLLSDDAAAGIYDVLDVAADRLIGFTPSSAVAGVVLLRDDYVSERDGAWTYGILIALTALKQKTMEV